MTDKRHYILAHETARRLAAAQCMTAPEGWHVIVQEPSRTLDQNAYQWPYLEGFSKQVQWPVNGKMEWLSPEEWKDILTAAFENDVSPRVAQGLDGGIVMLGRRTSKFGKRKFAEWMDWLMAAAALREVEPVFKNGSKRWREREEA